MGKGELDFHNTLAELEASWNNLFLKPGFENYTRGKTFDVWIPFKRNPDTGNYEYTTKKDYDWQPDIFNSTTTLTGSPLWAPGKPSPVSKDCVACVSGIGCYDEKCSQVKKIHKCKFSETSFIHVQGLCDKTALGNSNIIFTCLISVSTHVSVSPVSLLFSCKINNLLLIKKNTLDDIV